MAKRLKMIIKVILIVIAAVLLLAFAIIEGARAATYFSNHITAENGIDEGVYATLGGQEQYLLIRGENRDNPVLIWLHGGPASPEGYANYCFQKNLLSDYTVINWDQRGCGRTYFRNEKADPENKTATFEQLQTDLNDLVDYACQRFGKEKVIIVGHSYGSVIGSKYALTYPEKVSAFVGVGQFVSMESEIHSYEDALSKANEKGDDTVKMVEVYNKCINDKSLVNMLELRKYTTPYHQTEKSANTIWIGLSSPYMNYADARWFFMTAFDMNGFLKLNQHLFDGLMTVDIRDFGMEYEVPVGFITGAQDWTTPVKYAKDYCEAITAPEKKLVLIDGCGHAPQYDDSEAFCNELKGMLDKFLN